MAQLASALAWGASGRPFESDHPDQGGSRRHSSLLFSFFAAVLRIPTGVGMVVGYESDHPDQGGSRRHSSPLFSFFAAVLRIPTGVGMVVGFESDHPDQGGK